MNTRLDTEAGARTAMAVANCVSGPREQSDWIIEMFRHFLPTLDGLPGFRRFFLRELVHDGQDCMYVSLTYWDEMQAFHDWRASERFRVAHSVAESEPERFRQLNPAQRYDFPVDASGAPAELDEAILRRIDGDYRGVSAAEAYFRDVIAVPQAT